MKPGKENSAYLMQVWLPGMANDECHYRYSWPQYDKYGASYQFNRMKRTLLENHYKNNYTTAKFIEVKTGEVLHKMYLGKQVK